MSSMGSRPSSAEGSLMQDVPGAFPDPTYPPASTQLSLSQAIHARRTEFVRPKTIKIKVGSWNTASFKGTEKDIGSWFVQGQGISDALTTLDISSSALEDRESVGDQEARYARKQSTVPKNDPGSLPGGDDVDLYLLGLQEVVDVNSASEALRPYTDPEPSAKWKAEMERSLPKGYSLVAEQQLIGMLLLVYASPRIAGDVKSVSTTSVGTGLMGYMGNKGAVTARIVLGETTRLVFINCHLSAGADKAALDRRNWDYLQVINRTRFEPIQDSMDLMQTYGEVIDDSDFAFWVGDLNYRLEGIPGDDVRRLLMLHTRNEYDISRTSSSKVEHELARAQSSAAKRRRYRSSTDATTSTTSSSRSSVDTKSRGAEDESSTTSASPEDEDEMLDPSSDPGSLQATLDSLLPHDELQQQMKARKAFHDGWKEGDITFLPTYKYDPGSVGLFDSSEKKRGPSWCDRILYRTRRDRLGYESMLADEEAARKRDEEMKKTGIDQAAKEEEMLYEYDPDEDAADDDNDSAPELPEGAVITKEGFQDELYLEYYTAHQRVLSSDHKPLEALFTLKYDAVVPELKAKVHQDIARELDKAENEGRPSVTVVVDKHYPNDQEVSDDDPSKFEGVWFGHVRYAVHKHRSLTIANTGRVLANIQFVNRPVGAGQVPGIAPFWMTLKIDDQCMTHHSASADSSKRSLQPGDVCNVDMYIRIVDPQIVRDLNEGIQQLDDILVLRVENGRDHFIPLRGKWLESSLGRSIHKLIRIPEGGIRKLQRQRPKRGSRSSGSSRELEPDDRDADDVMPVKWSAPRELFRLTEAAENLTEAAIAEWGMTASADDTEHKPPWSRAAGWPFAEDSWSATTPEDREEGIAAVGEALDTDQPLLGCFDAETSSKEQRLESLAAFFMTYVREIADGVVTEEQWNGISDSLTRIDKEKTPFPLEDQRTLIQEILSMSPPHSISFILLTSMLDRIINEIVTASASMQDNGKHAPDLPISPLKRTATIKSKDLSKDAPIAMRQVVTRVLASIFAEVMVKTKEPAKDRDRQALEERKTRLVEMFLIRDG